MTLRRKLGEPRLVETVVGAGYRVPAGRPAATRQRGGIGRDGGPPAGADAAAAAHPALRRAARGGRRDAARWSRWSCWTARSGRCRGSRPACGWSSATGSSLTSEQFSQLVRDSARSELLRSAGAGLRGGRGRRRRPRAYVLAGRALQPVSRVTSTARRLSGGDAGPADPLDGPPDELKELADTFDAMLARLDAAFDSQRRFVANASHELRTPLAVIRTEVDVTLGDPAATIAELRTMGEVVREAQQRAERAGRRAAGAGPQRGAGPGGAGPAGAGRPGRAGAGRGRPRSRREAAARGLAVSHRDPAGAGGRRPGAAGAAGRQPGRERGPAQRGRRLGDRTDRDRRRARSWLACCNTGAGGAGRRGRGAVPAVPPGRHGADRLPRRRARAVDRPRGRRRARRRGLGRGPAPRAASRSPCGCPRRRGPPSRSDPRCAHSGRPRRCRRGPGRVAGDAGWVRRNPETGTMAAVSRPPEPPTGTAVRPTAAPKTARGSCGGCGKPTTAVALLGVAVVVGVVQGQPPPAARDSGRSVAGRARVPAQRRHPARRRQTARWSGSTR